MWINTTNKGSIVVQINQNMYAMKKIMKLTYFFAILLIAGFTSCTEDETMQQLIDEIELAQPMSTDQGSNSTIPPGS